MKQRTTFSAIGGYQPFLFCVGMYCVALFFSIFICSAIFYAVNPKRTVTKVNTGSDKTAMVRTGGSHQVLLTLTK